MLEKFHIHQENANGRTLDGDMGILPNKSWDANGAI